MKKNRHLFFMFFSKLMFSLILFCILPNIIFAMSEGESQPFGYTNGEQTFVAPVKGYYQLEVWGAQGGNAGGYGAYSTGVVLLEEGQKIYINVGGMNPSQYVGGYNGGGNAGAGQSQQGYGGGGATHIATVSGLLQNLVNNKNSVLIVAAGGGGQHPGSTYRGSHGGGIRGVTGYDTYRPSTSVPEMGWAGYSGTGATYTSGGYSMQASNNNCGKGSFGKGGDFCNLTIGGYGGGGGWYGGGGSPRGSHGGAGGGSSHIGNINLLSYNGITKATYCYNCEENSTVANRTIKTSSVNATATSNAAKRGAGYARITLNTLYASPNLS